MDEIERRLAALELLVSEWLALAPAEIHDALAARLAEGASADPDEQAIRAGALDWVEIARARDVLFLMGEHVRAQEH